MIVIGEDTVTVTANIISMRNERVASGNPATDRDGIVEHRLHIAYGLIAAIIMVGSIIVWTTMKRRAARKRRLRGIKDYNRDRP